MAVYMKSSYQEGLDEGILKGMEEGAQKNLKENILNLSEIMPPKDIANALKLPLEKVQEFLK